VPAKKRALIPAAIGAVVVLGAAGAWVALSGGKKAEGNPVDTSRVQNVAQDTARNRGALQSGGITTLSSRDTTHRAANPPPPPSLATRYDDSAGRRALDHLVDEMDNLSGQILVDSAQSIYRASSRGAAKGYAAYITAQFYLNGSGVRDVRAASDWITSALQQDPSNSKYRQLKAAIDREQP
jgi:hypothetical protein